MDNLNNNVIFNETNGIKYMQFKSLLKYNNEIIHAFAYNNDYAINDNTTNIDNYKKLCTELKLDYEKLFNIKQIHCDKSIFVDNNTIKNQEYDASITNIANILLLIKTADCMAILIYDYENKYISAIHAGWKGVLNRITYKTIKSMINNYHCNPKSLIVCVSPCICKECFEVDNDVKELFEKEFGAGKYLYKIKNSKYLIDLCSIVKDDMLSLGILDNNINFSNFCTKCSNNDFYSFRKNNTEKRMASIIMLK